jgi:hypothetical protein
MFRNIIALVSNSCISLKWLNFGLWTVYSTSLSLIIVAKVFLYQLYKLNGQLKICVALKLKVEFLRDFAEGALEGVEGERVNFWRTVYLMCSSSGNNVILHKDNTVVLFSVLIKLVSNINLPIKTTTVFCVTTQDKSCDSSRNYFFRHKLKSES